MTGKLPIFFLGLGKIFVTKYDKQEKITQLYFKIVIAKCDKELLQCVTGIIRWDRIYYKVWQLLKCAIKGYCRVWQILQSVTITTKWDVTVLLKQVLQVGNR